MDPKMREERKEEAAQEMFGKPFDQLDAHERVRAGGKAGGSLKAGELADPSRAPEPPAVKFGEDNVAAETAEERPATEEKE